jgi:adenosine deaminase
MTNALREFARRMPKAELHVHLEGSIQPDTLLTLARRNGQPLGEMTEAELREYYRFSDFGHFLQVYISILKCLRTPEDYRLIAYEFGRSMAEQNCRYAEVTFTIISNAHYSGLPWEVILDGLNAGRSEAEAEWGVRWGWIFDIVRDRPDLQDEAADMALAACDRGCVALGLAGDECLGTAATFQASFEKATAAGLPGIPHTGELCGPDKMWEVVRLLNPRRLQHGIRAVEDAELVRYLREKSIGCDVCPTSNVRLNVYPSYSAHPLRQLWDAGVVVTVNSDDPPLFNTTLNREYELLVDEFGFTAGELERASLNGIRTSLLPANEKARLMAEFGAEFARLRGELDLQ